MSAPHQLGGFRLDAVLASGGMAEVWRGVHEASGQAVAVKLMRSDHAQDARWLSAFRAEVGAMARLNHPAVVRVHDYGRVAEQSTVWMPGTPWLAMELVEGGTLVDRRPRSWSGIQLALASLLDALAAAHAADVIHRDIKPANVLISASDQVKLTDFGIAHALDRGQNEMSPLDGGTPPFMSPEQFEGRHRDTGPWTDLYALGCLAWWLVTGAPPYGNQRNWHRAALAHTQKPLPALRTKIPVPPELEGWLARLLQKEPAHRFRRAADASWALARMSMVSDAHVPDPEVDEPPPVFDSQGTTASWVPPSPDSSSSLPTILLEPLPRSERPDTAAPVDIDPPPMPGTWREGSAEHEAPLGGAGLGLFGLRSIPLVGRTEERDVLWAAIGEAVRDRAPRMVVLCGNAGTGKSRLLDWLVRRTRSLGTAVWSVATHGDPPSAGDGTAAMIRRDLQLNGLARNPALERVRRVLFRQGVRDGGEVLALASLAVPATPEEVVAGARVVRFGTPVERYALIARHLARRSEGRLAGLLIDDCQWSLDGLQLAQWLLENFDGPLMIAVAVRDEYLTPDMPERQLLDDLVASPGVRQRTLHPLVPTEESELLGRWLGLEPRLLAAVRRRTGGNPLFAVQLVGDWVDRGLLEPVEGGAFGLRGDLLPELPDSVHAMWMARVERVLDGQPQTWRAGLELAAALGMEVDAETWSGLCALAGFDAPFDLVDALARGRLARTDASGRWRFEHAMLRESVEREARDGGHWVDHNLVCVSWFRDRGDHGRVGRHLFAADRWDEAIEPLLTATRVSVFSTELRAADSTLVLAERAIELVQLPEDDPRRAVALLRRCRLAGDRGNWDLAIQTVNEALSLARRHGWRDHEGAALSRLGEIERDRPDLGRAQAAYRGALEVYEALGDQEGIAFCLHELGRVAMFGGDYEQARSLQARAREVFEESADPRSAGVAHCHRVLGELEVRREVDLDAAARHFRIAAERYRRLGLRFGEASCLNGQAEIARLQGDLEAAEAGYRRAVQLAEAMGHDGADAMRINLGLCTLARGELSAARDLLQPVGRRLSARERWGLVGVVDVLLLPGLAADEDWSSWDEHAERAARTLSDSGLLDRDVARYAELAGDLASAAGRQQDAAQAWAIAASQWAGLGEPGRARELLQRGSEGAS